MGTQNRQQKMQQPCYLNPRRNPTTVVDLAKDVRGLRTEAEAAEDLLREQGVHCGTQAMWNALFFSGKAHVTMGSHADSSTHVARTEKAKGDHAAKAQTAIEVEKIPCHQWQKDGKCSFGKNCRFKHDGDAAPSEEAKEDPKAEAKAKRKAKAKAKAKAAATRYGLPRPTSRSTMMYQPVMTLRYQPHQLAER